MQGYQIGQFSFLEILSTESDYLHILIACMLVGASW